MELLQKKDIKQNQIVSLGVHALVEVFSANHKIVQLMVPPVVLMENLITGHLTTAFMTFKEDVVMFQLNHVIVMTSV